MRLSLVILLSLVFVGSATAQNSCPLLSVIGPAGLIHPGDIATFTINADLDMTALKFQWTVSAGTIISGQGTPSIEVESHWMRNDSHIVATVEVSGLPDGCEKLASETVGISLSGPPITLDEYERITVKQERARLDAVAIEWKRFQHWYLYIILYLEPKETRASEMARIKRIKDHLTRTHKIPEERLVFVNGGVFQRSTKIYGVSEAAPKPDRK